MRTAMGSGVLAMIALCTTTVASAAPSGQPVRSMPDAGGLMRQIAAQPFRYGGDLDGSLLGLPEIGQRPVHLAIGLGVATPAGALSGSAILFDGDRHLIAAGPVDGMLRAQKGDAAPSCMLRLHLDGVVLANGAPAAQALPVGTVRLVGQCAAATLSGEIRSATPRPALLGRLLAWWGDRRGSGRYWLTADSFDPPPPSPPPPRL